jgi:hypothetical protein
VPPLVVEAPTNNKQQQTRVPTYSANQMQKVFTFYLNMHASILFKIKD